MQVILGGSSKRTCAYKLLGEDSLLKTLRDSQYKSQKKPQAMAFAIASEFRRKRPFARNFRNESETLAISFAKPFAIASKFLRSAYFAAFFFKIWWQKFVFPGHVRICIRIRSRIAANAVHSDIANHRTW